MSFYDVCNRMGWDGNERTTYLMEFIISKGLENELAVFAEHKAAELRAAGYEEVGLESEEDLRRVREAINRGDNGGGLRVR